MTGKRYTIYLFLAAMLSLVLHVAFPFLLYKIANTPPVSDSIATRVKIRIIHEPKVQSVSKPTKKNTDNSKKAAPDITPTKQDSDASEKDAEPLSYKNLFPTDTWTSGKIITGPSGRSPLASVATQKIAGQLSGQLDIPLVFRENSASGQAVAKFRLKSENEWYFEYIDGEPVLRAVLYQAFTKQINLDSIAELAQELNNKEIIFVIRQTTKPALDGWKQFSHDITYNNNRIVFSRTIYTGSDGSSGIPLPDKEAERAVMRDKVALRRLMDSPAYYSPIRNRKIESK